MRLILLILTLLVLLPLIAGCGNSRSDKEHGNSDMDKEKFEIQKSEEEWKKTLTPEQYKVLREKGTERAFTGEYDEFFEPGVYICAACGSELFESDTKYNSGCGWPAFWDVRSSDKVILKDDFSYGMTRTEVLCAKCGGHLGHLFDDGPAPTNQRYCINSVSLKFVPKK